MFNIFEQLVKMFILNPLMQLKKIVPIDVVSVYLHY